MPRKHRPERISDLLHELVATILHEDFNAPEGSVVTVTRVEIQEGLKTADVYVSVLPKDAGEEVAENLTGFVGEVQFRLMKRMRIKPIPRIRFILDSGIADADRIDQALAKLQKDDVG